MGVRIGAWRGAVACALWLAACGDSSTGWIRAASTIHDDPEDAGLVAGEDADSTGGEDATIVWPPDAHVPPDASLPAGDCQPTAGGPHWLLEGEWLQLQVRCATGLTMPGGSFTVAPLPRGMRWDATRALLEWTPALDQAAVYVLNLGVAGRPDQGQVKIGVADRFEASGNVTVRNPDAYTEEYGLPVVFVKFTGTPTKETPVPAEVIYRGHHYPAELKLHGVTSLDYPKKSFGLRFNAELFSDPERGFLARNKIRLTNTFDDNSYVRQRLAYALWERLEPGLITVKTFNVVVYLNGRYHGLYLLSDDVDKGLLRLHGMDDDGDLFKAVSNDANFSTLDRYGLPKLTMHQGYEKKEGLPAAGSPGAFDDLDDLVSLVARPPSDFYRRFEATARLRDFENWWMLTVFAHADDNRRKNYYLFRDRFGGPWRYAPWDWNGSFGQNYRTVRQPPQVRDYKYDNDLFTLLLDGPTPPTTRFGRVLRDQWELRKVLALYDGFIAEVAGEAPRDEVRWTAEYRSYDLWELDRQHDWTDFQGEAAYVRDWIEEQWRLLSQRYP